jgi:flavin-binding protein dodecin
MTEPEPSIVKVIEVVGSSERSFSDAVRNAVRIASRSVRNIRGVEVMNSTADVDGTGELELYKVTCKIAFLVEGRHVALAGTSDAPTGAELTTGGAVNSEELALGGGAAERAAT